MAVTTFEPIPGRTTEISLSRGLRRTSLSEWTKLRTLRSTWITIAVAVVSAIGLAVIASASDMNRWDEMSAAERADFDPVSTSLVGVLLAVLVLGALAVRSVTSEYSTGMIRVTFSATGERTRILFIKAALLFVLTTVVALFANVVSFALGQRILSSEGVDVGFDHPGVTRSIIAGALAVGLVAVVAVGLATLVRRTAAANIALSLVVVGGSLIGQAFPQSSRRVLPSSVIESTVSVREGSDLVEPWTAVAILGIYAVLSLAAASVALTRRDV